MTAADVIQQTQHKMGVTVEKLRDDFTRIRTGRASTGLLDKIRVDYYGWTAPPKHVGQRIGAPQSGCSGGRGRCAYPDGAAVGKEHGEGLRKSDSRFGPGS